ncbi:MAG: hypothetical protein JWO36_2327 [Myxococcales bacterium]|nr:hypothetical protein [Myxococcales bacterium]
MRSWFAILTIVFGGCASTIAPDPGLEGLALAKVAPGTIIPGTKVVVTGESFVDDQWGQATLHLVGQAGGTNIDVQWPASFVDFSTMNVKVDGGEIDSIGGDVDFHGAATIEFVAISDGRTYGSDPVTIDLSFRKRLTPTPTAVIDGVIFVNDQIEVDGDGFLLGGDEGTTTARIAGCFMPDAGGGCTPITSRDLQLGAVEPFSRKKAQFPFSPKLAGIKPGQFTGTVTIINTQTGIAPIKADPTSVAFTLVTSQVFSVDPPAASLGQFVFVHGGGFVGGEAGADTQLELTGTFNKTGGNPAQAQMVLIPEFVEGRLVRYVINTDDALGHALDLRKETGHFTGTITPIVTYNATTVRGVSSPATFDLAPVKQVVYLHFEAGYVEELRDFGMRAVTKQLRDRILAVVNRAYKGVNVEFRVDPPTDFALFENVDLTGVDPNNMGLFGYDNSPGKDNGNVRLYDKLGGVNATTQQDGYPGYGGVFVRSLMGFSKHPGSLAQSVPGADDMFDATFDPFRADREGSPITSADLAGGVTALTTGDSCPSGDRTTQVQCAIFVMGNLIGGTLAHEIGHSLGLANPYMDGFHDSGDAPNRLMDAGGDRPFLERAELQGQGPGVFCDDEYTYLRGVLPSRDPPNPVTRPSCF